MINIKLILPFTLIFLFFKNCPSENIKSKEDQNNLKSYFSSDQLTVMMKVIDNFDSIVKLNHNGKISLYLLELKRTYNNKAAKNQVINYWGSNNFIKEFKKVNLLREVYKKQNQKYLPSKEIIKWVDSIRNYDEKVTKSDISTISGLIEDDLSKNYTNNRIDSLLNNDNSRIVLLDNYYGKFHYGLYKSLTSKHQKTKNLIIEIVKSDGIHPSVYIDYIVSNFNEKELNNHSFKLIIFSEIILPHLVD